MFWIYIFLFSFAFPLVLHLFLFFLTIGILVFFSVPLSLITDSAVLKAVQQSLSHDCSSALSAANASPIFIASCCDIVVTQINYPSFKHNTQNSIKQARGRSHEEGSSQIFMLDDMQFEGGCGRYIG